MKHLIDKATIVAEINRVLNSYDSNEITSGRYALVKLRDFLDTIETTEDEHWQEVRERAAIAAMQGLLANSSKVGKIVDYTISAVDYADALIEQLKKKSQ